MTDIREQEHRVAGSADRRQPDGADANIPGVSTESDELHRLRNEVARLRAILTTPGTEDFMRDVEIEAAHQIDRWGADHDSGKSDVDWFWLIGYLAGKAVHDVRGKKAHHIIATAAVLLNWHRAVIGDSNHMRPGIAPPQGDSE